MSSLRTRATLLAALPAFLSLAGCQTMDNFGSSITNFDIPSMEIVGSDHVTTIPQGDCPAVSRVAELSSLYQFTNPARPTPATAISESHITRVASKCARQGSNLQLSLNVNFDGGLGPKARIGRNDKPSFAYPYFVAITNSKNQILSKEIFAVSFAYDSTGNIQTQTETLNQVVPLGGDDPKTYRILIGFQLAPEELAYNRKLPQEELGKSLTISTKIPAIPEGF